VEQQNITQSRSERAILSVKFSLAEKNNDYATKFALAMKTDKYLKEFKTYNPNTWEKDSCDPDFTNNKHKCRGSQETCEFSEHQNLTASGNPAERSCWRFAFRFHLMECQATNGFMIQVQEKKGLGEGQKIETVMAEQVGVKVFRTSDRHPYFDSYTKFSKVANAVKAWYKSGCRNMDMEIIDIDFRSH